MPWKIIVKDHKRTNQKQYTFTEEQISIGRDPNVNQIIIDNTRISKEHAKLTRNNGLTYIEDLSLNGVFIIIKGIMARIKGTAQLRLPAMIALGKVAELLVDYDHDQNNLTEISKDVTYSEEDETIIPNPDALGMTESILVLDQCNATGLACTNQSIALALTQRLEQIAKPILDQHHAQFKKGTGDGFLATFAEPFHALAAAQDLSRQILMRNSKTSNPLIHFRIALHHGKTFYSIVMGKEDIGGSDVNFAFRLEGLQEKKSELVTIYAPFPTQDRILCSSAFVQELLSSKQPVHVDLLSIGLARFQGIPHDHEVFLALLQM